MNSLHIAATGMSAQQTNVDIISNNLANMNTTGYKKAIAHFQDLIYMSKDRSGVATSAEGTIKPVSVEIGLGVKTAGVGRILTQGALTQTDNDLSMAVDGRGYFIINMPDGSQSYTRDGSFKLSPEGAIVTNEGYELDPGINIPQDAIKIEVNQEGVISAFNGNNLEPVELGQINLATFINETGMRSLGGNLYAETPASGEAEILNPNDPGAGRIRQGFLEASNVDAVDQITRLISAQRAYEMNSKAVSTADQMMQTASNVR
jgi:flagellar basal-body rod protein FlgG